LDDVFREALKAFATLGYDGVSMRNLNRDSGGSHNLLSGRFGSKKTLWYATVDWAFGPLVHRLATAFDPTLTDPLVQLRITIPAFLLCARSSLFCARISLLACSASCARCSS
jgi:AcrR family transcriptional regulator